MRWIAIALLLLAACDGGDAAGGPRGTGGSGGAGGSGGTGGDGTINLVIFRDLIGACSQPGYLCSKTVVRAPSSRTGAIALGRDCAICTSPAPVHLLVPNERLVVALDRNSGAEAWELDLGVAPHSIAVSLDASSWVTSDSGVAHLDPSGTVLCHAPIAGVAGPVAIDPQTGDAWVGNDQGNVFGFDSVATLPPDICKPLDGGWSAGFPLIDLAMDDRGVTWANSGGAVVRNGPVTGVTPLILSRPASHVVIDPTTHDAWLDGDGVQRVAADPPYDPPYDQLGIAPCKDGIVARGLDAWCADGKAATQVDLTNLQPVRSKLLDTTAVGLVDVSPFLWLPQTDGSIARIDPRAFTGDVIPGRPWLAASGDPTGQRVIDFPALRGIWEFEFPIGAAGPAKSIAWSADVPDGAAVVGGVVFADKAEDLAGQRLTCLSETGSLELSSCAGAAGAHFGLFVLQLRTSPAGESPSVRSLTFFN